MSWIIFHGRGLFLEAGRTNPNGGSFIESRQTEEEALQYAVELIRKGQGIHSISQLGHEPKYRHADIVSIMRK